MSDSTGNGAYAASLVVDKKNAVGFPIVCMQNNALSYRSSLQWPPQPSVPNKKECTAVLIGSNHTVVQDFNAAQITVEGLVS